MEHIRLGKILGNGAYGKVYECINDKNEHLAIKCIPIQPNDGIPCLMEAIIMMTFDHPYLNRAIKIYSTEYKLYIIQDYAPTDLGKWITQSYDENIDLDSNTLRKWLFCLSQALYCLHSNNIIHADIKSSNILLYQNNQIKLTDYTLSTMSHWNHNHTICTSTHRPPEVWLKRPWDKKVDIWSLGCTLFEIVYKYNLFVYQGHDPINPDYETDANVNCILDWTENHPLFKDKINISHRNASYKKPRLPKNFNPRTPLNSLILKMLRFNPADRPSIDEILKDEYFMGMTISPYKIMEIPEIILNSSRKDMFNKISNEYNYGPVVTDLAEKIYSKIAEFRDLNDTMKVETVLWIAYKLVNCYTSTTSHKINLSKIFINERLICNYLSYRLYSSKHILIDN